MSSTWFTADQHFGHTNIIKYCNRPFCCAKEMDDEMILRWNAVVEPGDTVYHLGDFTMEGYQYAKDIFAQLNGAVKILALPWHHDRRWLAKAKTAPPHTQGKSYTGSQTFIRLLPPIEILTLTSYIDGRGGSTSRDRPMKVTLGHYPMASWEASYHGAWHLHGHSHGQYDGGGFMMDVGVDSWNFTPVSMNQVRHFMRTQEGQTHARQGGWN
jgi:calcineurin-like phosphoesterase family protein